MNKEVYYNLFNDKVDEFFKDLIQSFPNITDFRKFKTGLMMLRNVNSKMPQQVFQMYVLSKYRDAMLNSDETVFLNHTYEEVDGNEKEYWLKFIDQIKKIWKTLDDSNKRVIWKYFHVLIVLSDKCI